VLKKILKILIIILVVGILAGLSAWLVLSAKWPWWAGLALFVGVTGVWVGILFLIRYLQRRREKVFVERVIAQDEAAIKAAPIHERERLQELQDHWKESVELLRGSYLRKLGNPLYVLPWYLVIGESGSGKTSAIRNAGLSSPITDIGPAATISATRNCDWWFFEDAIILDTAGRYTIPIDEETDKEEWKKFLSLLAKYRRREPVNGVIVTISADKLLAQDEGKLRDDGQSARQRIDQLMRTTGAKFPVYLMVTKMDLVHGFVDFCSHLSREDTSQSLGSINEKMNPYWNEFLDQSLSAIADRLKELRLMIAEERGSVRPGALIFPDEFEKLKPGIEAFTKAVFEENPYQETPLFRGVYFSSARQEGQPQSEFLCITGFVPSCGSVDAGAEGLFLKDIFKSILPEDRYLYRPIREFLRWRTLTSSQGLLAWIMVWLSMCGLLSYSFFKNSITIGDITREFTAPPVLTGDMSTDLLMLDKFRLEILQMEQRNKNWWVPRFGLDESVSIERKLKRNYTRLFEDKLFNPFETIISGQIEKMGAQTPNEDIALYVSYTAVKINHYKEVLEGKIFSQTDRFDRVCTDLITKAHHQMIPEIAARFDDIYYSYLIWNEDRIDLKEKIKVAREALIRLLEKKGDDLSWLVGIHILNVPDVCLSDFWGVAEEEMRDEKLSVSRAYTEGGRKNINDFKDLLDKVLLGKAIQETDKSKFWNWYWKQFYESWGRFAQRFSEGIDGLGSISSWKQMAALMSTDRNPYFRLLDRMSEEFARSDEGFSTPRWASLVLLLSEIKQISKAQEEKAKGTLAGKVEGIKEKVVGKAREVIEKKDVKKYEEKLKIAKVWEDYLKALAQLSPAASSRDTCLTMLADYFTQTEGEKKPLFLVAHNEGFKLKSMMKAEGDIPLVWNIVLGPFNFLLDYGIMETGCALQDKWGEQVLGALEGVGREKSSQVLFNKSNGVVWKYINGPAQPFITKGKNGYIARKNHDKSVQFNSEFFDFLNAGAQSVIVYQPDYSVTMKTLPLQVNKNARVEPYGSVVSLECADEKISLENYNYPQSKTFRWSPEKCGDVTLKILLPELVLNKTYEGPMGFPRLLSEFRYGVRTFNAEEFPNEQKRLKDMGISWVRMSYQIAGEKAVLKLLKSTSVRTPEEIVPCWSQ